MFVAGGTNIAKAFTFTATGTCGSNVTATLQLQDGAANLGTVFYTFSLGAPTTTPAVYSYGGAPVAIPDNTAAGTNIPIPVSGLTGGLTGFQFSYDGSACSAAANATANGLNHNCVGDLIVKLTSPHGTTVTLLSRPGAGAPDTGPYIPYQPLAAFLGEDPNGTWMLNVSDRNAGDTGNVRAFSLRLYGWQCCSGNADSSGDGIPDSWRLQYFGSGTATNSRSCAACDPDGDGVSNLAEYLAGTNPTNSASALRITDIHRETNRVRVTWLTFAGKTNALERTAALTNTFSAIFTATNTVAGTTNYLDVGAATNSPPRYYRIRLVP